MKVEANYDTSGLVLLEVLRERSLIGLGWVEIGLCHSLSETCFLASPTLRRVRLMSEASEGTQVL